MTIEKFLGLSRKEIKERMDEEERKISTVPGTGFLEEKLKRFHTSESELIIYLAYYQPELLNSALNRYADYNGNEVKAVIIEDLREYYILGKLFLKYSKNTKE